MLKASCTNFLWEVYICVSGQRGANRPFPLLKINKSLINHVNLLCHLFSCFIASLNWMCFTWYVMIWAMWMHPVGHHISGATSAVSVANVSFQWTNLLSQRSEQNHFMNWFIPFSVQLSSAASMPAGSGTAVTHTENCEDVIRSLTVLKVALCHPLTQGRGVGSRSVTILLKLALCC